MAEYPSNSYKSKRDPVSQEKRDIQPVVKHATSIKPVTKAKKFSDLFSIEDFSSVKTYVLKDLLVPSLKKIFLNTMAMWLKTTPTSSSGLKSSGGTSVTYANYYQKQETPMSTIRPSDYPDFGTVLFEDRGDAEYVRNELLNLRQRYPVVRVSDYYDLAKQPAPYTSNRYGWTDLNTIEVVRVGDKYTLSLPKAYALD